MAKKKGQQAATESSGKVDLSNLIDAAKSSFFQFDDSDDLKSMFSSNLMDETETEIVSETIASTSNDDLSKRTELDAEIFQFQDLDIAGEETCEGANSNNQSAGASVAEVFDADEIEEIQLAIEELTEIPDTLNFSEATEVIIKETTSDELIEDSFSEFENKLELKHESELESESAEATEIEGLFSSQIENTIDQLESPEVGSENADINLRGTELEGFDSVAIEELEFVEDSQLESIVESVLFATDRPVSFVTLKQIFKGTNVTNARLKRAIEILQVELAGGRRGVTLEEVGSGYQLRTKIDNVEFLRRSFKAKAFKLSGPALEVLAITAYKQPVVKVEIDEIRGVESGHLLRALMEKNLVLFAGKSDLPGKPMQYATSRKFLEIFGLRNLKELPTLSQIDELIPDGIGEEDEKPKLADITDGLSEKAGQSYSEGEDELTRITDQLEKIDTSSEFFEKEKIRQKQEKDDEKARNLREAIAVKEKVSTRDINWLKRYDEQIAQGLSSNDEVKVEITSEEIISEVSNDESDELEAALRNWDSEDLELAERLEDNDLADIDQEIV